MNRSSIWRERCAWLIGHAGMVAETWCLAVLVEVTVRWVSFATILGHLARHAGSGTPIPVAPPTARRAVRMAFALLPFECTCLRESLILCRMYQRRHHHVELRLGAQIENGTLKVHAWVEDDHGTPLTESFGYLPLPLPLATRQTC